MPSSEVRSKKLSEAGQKRAGESIKNIIDDDVAEMLCNRRLMPAVEAKVKYDLAKTK